MSKKDDFATINQSINESLDRYNAHQAKKNTNMDNYSLMMESIQNNRQNRAKYLSEIKDTLVFESLNHFYSRSVDQSCYERNEVLMKNNLKNYIKENDAENILGKMRYGSYLLSEMSCIIDETYKDIMDDSKEDNGGILSPDKEKINDFMKRINNLQSSEDVENVIRMRVADAEEEFITNQMQDKFNTKNIMAQTAQRLDNIKQDTSGDTDQEAIDYNTAAEQEAAIDVTKNINKIIDRDKSVFESMVFILSEAVMKDEGVLHETYAHNNDLNVDSVVESVKCVYALMETLNSLKLEKIDEVYLNNFLSNFA